MSYLIRIKHPGIDTYCRACETLPEARNVYTSMGMVPGGFKMLSDTDCNVVKYEEWTISKDYTVGQMDAFAWILEQVGNVTFYGCIDKWNLEILRDGIKSTIRNAQDQPTEYSKGAADAMGLIFRLVSHSDTLSEDRVNALRGDLKELCRNCQASAGVSA